MMKSECSLSNSEACQSPIETKIDTNTALGLPQEAESINGGSSKTIPNSPLKLIKPNPNEEDTILNLVPYIDTPQEAMIIGDDPRWRLNPCACKANSSGDKNIRVSRAANPKRLKSAEQVRVCEFKPSSNNIATTEIGSSVCEICSGPKSVLDLFRNKNCFHAYCSDCVVSYVSSKLQDNDTTIGCPVPECRGFLEPQHCVSIISPELLLRWGKALCEAVSADSDEYCMIFNCPFKDCSAMLIDAEVEEVDLLREAECPQCWRLFCARCKAPRLAEVDSEEFQELNKDERKKEDIMVIHPWGGEDPPSVVSKSKDGKLQVHEV